MVLQLYKGVVNREMAENAWDNYILEWMSPKVLQIRRSALRPVPALWSHSRQYQTASPWETKELQQQLLILSSCILHIDVLSSFPNWWGTLRPRCVRTAQSCWSQCQLSYIIAPNKFSLSQLCAACGKSSPVEQTIFHGATESFEIANIEKSQKQQVMTYLYQWFFSSFVDLQLAIPP